MSLHEVGLLGAASNSSLMNIPLHALGVSLCKLHQPGDPCLASPRTGKCAGLCAGLRHPESFLPRLSH